MASPPSADADLTGEGIPDLMNDPAYASNIKDEPDTCRICRSEGTAEEPLFYPCKCSGSIKFVHQDCLMEWLSHSQKKHCELCKTRFRFTKLYHPQMPPTLPTTVFLRMAVAHLYKSFITWCRALLVVFVWLVLLPWSMRIVWRGLFWLADGGWVRENSTVQPAGILGIAQTFPEAVASASAALTNQFANATDSFLQSWRSSMSLTFTQNISGSYHSTAHGMMNLLLSTFGTPSEDPTIHAMPNTTSANNTTPPIVGHGKTSLLSGFTTLDNLTRSPRINATIIDVLEGQIITLSVMFIFVLIFLIREWVVGQQPLINMAAAEARVPAVPVAAMDHDQHQDQLARQAAQGPVQQVENAHGNDAHGPGVLEQHAATEPDVPRDASSLTDGAEPINGEQRDELENLRVELRQQWESLSVEQRQAVDQDKIDQIYQILKEDETRAPAEDNALNTLSTEISVKAEPSSRPTSSAGSKERSPSQSIQDISDAPPDCADGPTNRPIRLEESKPTAEVAEHLDVTEETQTAGKEGMSQRPMSRSRPPMPQRCESFKATGIQRELEELLRDGAAETSQSKPTVATEDESDGEQSSGDHSEAWQRIATPSGSEVHTPAEVDEGFITDTAPLTGSAARGKEEMTQEVGNEPSVPKSESTAETSQSLLQTPPVTFPLTTVVDRALTESLPVERQNNNTPGENSFEQPRDQREAPVAHGDPLPDAHNEAGPSSMSGNAQDDGLVSRLLEWLWGDIAPAELPQNDEPNDEHIVGDLAEEAPFVPFANAQPVNGERQDDNRANQNDNPLEANVNPDAEEVVLDAEVVAAARAAGIDPNDDDAEDLEGLMELFGMQGPITGLAQNAIFGAFLVAVTVAVAVWLPYVTGKIVLFFMGNPITMFIRMPVQLANALANLCVDLAIFVGSLIIYWTDSLISLAFTVIAWLVPWFERVAQYDRIATLTRPLAESAFRRIGNDYNAAITVLIPDVVNFSWRSLAALRSIQHNLSSLVTTLKETAEILCSKGTRVPFATLLRQLTTNTPGIMAKAYTYLTEHVGKAANGLWSQAKLGTLTVSVAQTAGVSEPSPPFWTVTDRLIAILTGYGFFAFAGAVYLSRGRPITSSQRGIRIEGIITEMLQQAGGILKVIFIIGIEMIVFPLYCGLLLGFALLPLFEGATFSWGFIFMMSSPWTSGFAHWFIGTCYMFHFALFVSMCRRILRKGVLHFIRDPDDPSFHPVRDVLEKSVTSQLRKIAFSAMVYGGLVIFGLGIVVWSLFYAFPGVLPIRWRSPELLLEVPLDLLVYNFLALSAPLLVVSLKPSSTLQSAYDWWMRKCARMLRLSDFLFRQPQKDELEGFGGQAWKMWRFWSKSEGKAFVFPPSGRFVRAPASDHVRISRGRRIFVEVDINEELEGLDDLEKRLQTRSDENYTIVYIPPWFRVRIGLFLCCLWVFSAGIGLLVTIVPLLFGRRIFHFVAPDHIQMNDIYAFGIGSFMLGSLAIAILHSKRALDYISTALSNPSSTVIKAACGTAAIYATRTLRVLYTYTAVAVFIPCLLALLLEFYVILPLHTYMGSGSGHIIHAIQDWTLGVLYTRIVVRIILDNQNSRPARVIAAVMRDGYLNPNVRLATRCVLMPLTVLIGIVLVAPLPVGHLANKAYFPDASPTVQTQVYRYAYPAVAAVAFAMWMLWRLGRATARWRRRIRDEVYLIGERLHNFGEARARPEVAHRARRIRT